MNRTNELKAFISYASADRACAKRLAKVLSAIGLSFFLDESDIRPGQDIVKSISAGVQGCSDLVVLISLDSLRSAWLPFEVGQAVALQKRVVPYIVQKGLEPPAYLHGFHCARQIDEVRRYFEALDPSSRALRDMLIPPTVLPKWILASPKSLPVGQPPIGPWDLHTYGDHTGILGLITAFGQLMGETAEVELVSARPVDEELLKMNAHFYLIGSPKVNDWTERMMANIQKKSETKWLLRPKAHHGRSTTGEFELSRMVNGKDVPLLDAGFEIQDGEHVGVILRGPFDDTNPKRFCTILAGPKAVGTSAACLAATRSPLISEIILKLGPNMNLGSFAAPIWVLVKGRSGVKAPGALPIDSDGHLYPAGVTIVDAGLCE